MKNENVRKIFMKENMPKELGFFNTYKNKMYFSIKTFVPF